MPRRTTPQYDAKVSVDPRPHNPGRRTGSARSPNAPIRKKVALPVACFLLSLFIPWIITIGPLSLSVYRIVLIGVFVPVFIGWLYRRSGRIIISDFLIIAFCIWCTVSFIVVQGISAAIEPSGIIFIETVGSYFLARRYIRDEQDFRNMISIVVKIIIFLLPFALYEAFTGNKPILAAFNSMAPIFTVGASEIRLGLRRVQGPFEHPILFGVFCGSVLAVSHLVLSSSRRTLSHWLSTGAVGLTALASMSSAPIAGLAVQISLMLWNHLLRSFASRWKLLWALIFAAYLVVEFGSNQTPIQFYISHFTFDQQTGWYRIWIWEYGSASVLNHPLFGTGLTGWARPKFMVSDTIDNFWLVIAIRHGIPAFVLLLGSCLVMMLAVASRRGISDQLQNCRVAYLICLATFVIVGTTVHLWSATYVWFIFILGSGAWLLDAEAGGEETTALARHQNVVSARATRRTT